MTDSNFFIMISSLDDYAAFLCKHSMSGDQFLFCCLIYEKKFHLIYKLYNERGGFNRDELRDLEDRGYVINTNTGEDLYADGYVITDQFVGAIYGNEYSMFQELIDTYPQFIFIEQKKIPAQSCDLDSLRMTYFGKVGRNVNLHKKIIKLLKFGIDNDLVNMGIEKWVKSEQWKALEHEFKAKPNEAYGGKEF